MKLTGMQVDRACGALVGTAAGDALGAPFEFGPPLSTSTPVEMTGGGSFGWAPGEWTDDTSMAIAIAEIASSGADLRDEHSKDQLVHRWIQWRQEATDVGVQTSIVLDAAARHGSTALGTRDAARAHHVRTGRSGGNGSLMRTVSVALAFLDDEAALVEAARAISELTHFDLDAGDACVLWCASMRHAVLTGELDGRIGLPHVDAGRRELWAARFAEAEASHPSDFAATNGWVVSALQAAWCAITTTPVPDDDPVAGVFRADHLRLALESAVRGGKDTDTVAAIAGGILGAVYGVSAVPGTWRRLLHGWPGLRTPDLVRLVTKIVRGGPPAPVVYDGWEGTDVLARHPHDDAVWIGGVNAVMSPPDGVSAVVSLCKIPDVDLGGIECVEVRLIDRVGENANLDFVLLDAVRTVEQFRSEGRKVLLHCVAAQSRTPSVAALYGARRAGIGIDRALADVMAALPDADPNPDFRAALRRLHTNRKEGQGVSRN
jgi:ADP-ribosyl-[dinitrogen reductase] hydrolase